MEQKENKEALVLPANIWEKYTKIVEKEGKQVVNVDFKSIVLEQQYEILVLKEQIKKLNEAMGYLASWMENEENKNKIEIIKPSIILPE